MASRLLGVDYGKVRVGLALAEATGAPERLVTLQNSPQLISDLVDCITKHDVATIVVGLPRDSDGQETTQSAEVRAFVGRLQAATAVPIKFQDEFDTTQQAALRLGKRSAEPGLIDQEAAVIILEDYAATA